MHDIKAWLESQAIEYPVDSPIERIHRQISFIRKRFKEIGVIP